METWIIIDLVLSILALVLVIVLLASKLYIKKKIMNNGLKIINKRKEIDK